MVQYCNELLRSEKGEWYPFSSPATLVFWYYSKSFKTCGYKSGDGTHIFLCPKCAVEGGLKW